MNFKRKLWWAQHKNDVYKYSTFILLFLVITISIIHFTYSKFSSSNEMTMYETTVEPFIKNDYFIASYIDGEWSNEIPGKDDGYVVDKIVCDNGAVGTWDNDKWGITITDATKKIKCGVYFQKAFKLIEQIATLATTDTANFVSDDPDNNVRYIGKDPNNYVYFNCSDYSNQSDSTCEKWRIIGLFNNIIKEDGSTENLIKIVRKEILNNALISWDFKNSGVGTSSSYYGSSDWTDSQLMMMLNPIEYIKNGYSVLNGFVRDQNIQHIYQNMGSYYNGTLGCLPSSITRGSSFNCSLIDFTSTGLKNVSTRNAIESVVWNLGGTDVSLLSTLYKAERGTVVSSNHATQWIGKIGLIYSSDYGYATAGGSIANRATCLTTDLANWNNEDVKECKNNDYLYDSTYIQWTLAPWISYSDTSFSIGSSGSVGLNSTSNSFSVRPTLYLKSDITILKGDGSETNPYQLSLQ